jgi:diacylglycerol kinase (ATP)
MRRQVTLLLNPHSGNTKGVNIHAFMDAFETAGYHCHYRATLHEEELDEVLEGMSGLVVAIGGDGTFRAVAKRLVGKGVPLSILPMGTANNVARAFKMPMDPYKIIAGLVDPRMFPFDVGCIKAPWGEDYFFEGAGCGFYAEVLANYRPEEGKSVLRALSVISDAIRTYKAQPYRVRLDGDDLSGTYLMLEVLNTPTIGPRLSLAPDAHPSDTYLDLLRLGENERANLLNYLRCLVFNRVDELEEVHLARGKRIEILWQGQPFHVDGEVRPGEGWSENNAEASDEHAWISIDVLPHALELWLPRKEGV